MVIFYIKYLFSIAFNIRPKILPYVALYTNSNLLHSASNFRELVMSMSIMIAAKRKLQESVPME